MRPCGSALVRAMHGLRGWLARGVASSRPCLLHKCLRWRTVGERKHRLDKRPLPPLADLLHLSMSLLAAAVASPMASLMVPDGDKARCEAALLFFNLLLGGLLPLLLLVPLSVSRPQGGGDGDAQRRPQSSCLLARLEGTLSRTLGCFIYEQHAAEGRSSGRMSSSSLLVMRWVVLVACTWVVACMLYA